MLMEFVGDEWSQDRTEVKLTFKISHYSHWKVMRWIELINAYDCMVKSCNKVDKLVDEIENDYNKDFDEDE